MSQLLALGAQSIGGSIQLLQSNYVSISPSNEYSRLIPFEIDWFDLCCPKDISQKKYGQLHRATLNFMLWMNSDNLKVTAERSVRMLLQKTLGRMMDMETKGVEE